MRFLLLFLVMITSSFAQGTVTIFGTIQDESKAVITWSTNKGAICDITYSKNNGLDEKKLRENGFGYNHGVVIPGLDMGQAYVYQIVAKDRWGNIVKSGNYAVYSGKKAVSVIDLILNELQKMFGWAKVK